MKNRTLFGLAVSFGFALVGFALWLATPQNCFG